MQYEQKQKQYIPKITSIIPKHDFKRCGGCLMTLSSKIYHCKISFTIVRKTFTRLENIFRFRSNSAEESSTALCEGQLSIGSE